MRHVILDTETTGLDPGQGHRIIEIGCVELLNRRPTGRHFQRYLQPDRTIDAGAMEVHGISTEFLADKPRFADIAEELLEFIGCAELIIHNAAFDVAFLNHELKLWRAGRAIMPGSAEPAATAPVIKGQLVGLECKVQCTLILARQIHPGQKNSLDALCKRYAVDNSHRQWHGALLDAQILAGVYLAMTGGQASLSLHADEDANGLRQIAVRRLAAIRPRLLVRRADSAELAAHQLRLESIDKASGGQCVWLKLATATAANVSGEAC